VTGAVAALLAAGFAYYVVPRIVGLGPTLRLLRRGDPWWLALGVLLEVLSYGGAIVLFRGVFTTAPKPVDWKTSYRIMVAGAAANKLVSAGGAGGIALGVWALRGYGLAGGEVATGMVAYAVLTYGVYMIAMAVAGFGLWFGLFSGPAPVGVTLVPAVLATVAVAMALSMLFLDEPLEKFLNRRAERSEGRAAERWRRAAAVPKSIHAGLSAALGMVKRRDPSVLGAVANWGFDIGVLWASYRAFGESPPGAVLVMGYYVGTLANVLPIPGGVGGVEAGMIGAFLAFRVQRHLAVLAVLAYRTISFWLPTVPGAIAYFRLRRQFSDDDRSPQPAARP
jgi:uncharacterized protein (TIRG00374 family)